LQKGVFGFISFKNKVEFSKIVVKPNEDFKDSILGELGPLLIKVEAESEDKEEKEKEDKKDPKKPKGKKKKNKKDKKTKETEEEKKEEEEEEMIGKPSKINPTAEVK